MSNTFYDKTILDGGVEVITETIDTVRSVAIGIWFAVGSRDESPAEAGMSHFMEHMMFKGTPTRTAAEISQHFDRLGGELNAFTSKEYTCFYARVLDEHVDDAVEVLSDMCVSSLLADEAITPEREVVLEEISRHDDTPDDAIHELFASTLMPDHPLGLPILGQRETVGSFDHAAAADFKQRHYVTGNVIVAAAGHIDHARVVELVKRYLTLPEGTRTPRGEREPVVSSALRVVRKDTEQAHICWGVKGLRADSTDRFTLSILDSVLGGGMSSRLFQEIREKNGLAYAVFSYHSLYLDTGQYTIYAGTRPSNAEQVITLIKQEVEKITQDGITADELSRSKDSIKGQLVLGLESTRARMSRLGKSEVTNGEILSLDELVSRVDAVTGDDVRDLAQRLFSGPRVLAMIAPLDAEDVAHLL
ncbi:MAG: processing [Actinobacteria bacterium]|nr:MAG: processing [Actinomycetota bacterium]MDO8949896.1 pitrilysin family protein [Actinomycetota bacterium]